jgi:hypothetical protein
MQDDDVIKNHQDHDEVSAGGEQIRSLCDIVSFYYFLYPFPERDDGSDTPDSSNTPNRNRIHFTPVKYRGPSLTAMSLSQHFTTTSSNTSKLPNRWPKSLEMSKNNLYWIRNSNTPCICFRLNVSQTTSTSDVAPLLQVLPVCVSTYHHAISVPSHSVISFDEVINSKTSYVASDQRSYDFALAL